MNNVDKKKKIDCRKFKEQVAEKNQTMWNMKSNHVFFYIVVGLKAQPTNVINHKTNCQFTKNSTKFSKFVFLYENMFQTNIALIGNRHMFYLKYV